MNVEKARNVHMVVKKMRQPRVDGEIEGIKHIQTAEWKTLKDEMVPFTVELAEWLIDMPCFSGERPLKDWRVTHLVELMKNGRFLPANIHLAVCNVKKLGITRRVNGQHTAWARAWLPKNYNPLIRLTAYEADDDQDFRNLYNQFDGPESSRSNQNRLIAKLYDTPEFKDIHRLAIVRMAQGHLYWRWGETPSIMKSITLDQRADALFGEDRLLAFAVASGLQMRPSPKHFITKMAVVGAMFSTFINSHDGSLEFWSTASEGSNLRSNDPRHVLRDWLMTSSMETRFKAVGSVSRFVSAMDVYNACITAWNTWRRGDTMTCIRVFKKMERLKAHK